MRLYIVTISYCLPIWSLTTKEVTEPIPRLYNRALKIHKNLPKRTHHCTALTQSHALSFQNCIYSHAIKFYFQLQQSTSQTLISLLPTHNMPQVRVTRSVSMALHRVPTFNNVYGQRSSIHTFTKVWNGIPHHIRVLQSITQFKKAYKLLLLNTYTNTDLHVLCPCFYVLYVNVTCDVPCPCMLYCAANRNLLEISYFTETGPIIL